MATEAVQPLRINKNTGQTPQKMSRPLSEIGSTEQRRNSPSYNQATRKMIVKGDERGSSPFDSSPFQRSPRTFWEDRETLSPTRFVSENSPERDASPAVAKRRSSIENLKKASRVKNSSMFERETKNNYDPSSSPIVERPLSNRPWGVLQNNAFARFDSLRKENSPLKSPDRPVHRRAESKNDIPLMSPSKIPAPSPAPSPAPTAASPRKEVSSPVKSSLTASSRYTNSFEPDAGTWSDGDDEARVSTPRAGPRHAKSVTFETQPEINEYEQQTPEPSSIASGSREGSFESEDCDEDSFERASSAENEDSFDASLEDTEKTPVVLPEDWRHMSPDTAPRELVDEFDDVFGEGSPAPTATPMKSASQRPASIRSDSATSDGDFRPLPPIPGFTNSGLSTPRRGRVESGGLAAAAERASSAQRSLPSPPRPASVSKADILRMREANMSLEDRMGLMALQESLAEVQKSQSDIGLGLSAPAEMTERKMTVEETEIYPDDDDRDDEDDDLADLADFVNAPSISRESIMRNVKSRRFEDEIDDDFTEDESAHPDREWDYKDLANLDPDVPIPSRETSTHFGQDAAVAVKLEDESFIDLDAIPTLASGDLGLDQSAPRPTQHDRQSSVIHNRPDHDDSYNDDEESRYSSPMSVINHQVGDDEGYASPEVQLEALAEDDAFSTPLGETTEADQGKQMSLPLLTGFLDTDDYDFGLKSYITPSPPASDELSKAMGDAESDKQSVAEHNPVMDPPELLQPTFGAEVPLPRTPSEHSEDMSIDRQSFESAIHSSTLEESPVLEEPVIPERRATIKTGGKLKARPSGTPADLQAMIAQRRQVSEEPTPSIPDQYRAVSSSGSEVTETESLPADVDADDRLSENEHDGDPAQADSSVEKGQNRRQSRKQLKLDLDIPVGSFVNGSGLGMDAEFDRMIESQNRGYLMRQNTKVVVASNRDFSNENPPAVSPPMSPSLDSHPETMASRGTRSAGSSPRKPSGEKYLTTEPWVGKTRRKSTRKSSGRTSNINGGPAPPLPGQESALGTVDEYMATDEVDEGAERGRLFVKVVGVKDLDLPLPRNDRLYFQLTLDNGLHCVTTSNLELGKTASIGQEFELVVLEDLEFQLTLTTKLPPAPKQAPLPPQAPPSPTKSTKSSNSMFSRLLSSPKKRAERERREREEAAEVERRRQEEHERKRASVKPTPWDHMREVVDAKSGSFARAYVSLKSHETQCFGRQLTVDIPCFNEWALEKDVSVVSSVRSKRNNGNLGFGRTDGTIRRPPYTIGKLELQLLFVPKPKNASDSDMPKSMSGAIREMKAAEQVKESTWEGTLSQQGGDCPYWRRRFFRLQGTKLTAYHEHTMQPRATINLSKASKLIDDKTSLIADPTSANPSSSKRRKSAFAEEDDGYQFVEEGFRIRFANGETIDFYADNAAQKDGWMAALSQSVGKPASNTTTAKWTDVILAKERSAANAAKAVAATTKDEGTDRKSSGRSQASSSRSGPSVPPKDGVRSSTPPMSPRTGHRDRQAVKSMIF
ncbi:hypothetical protein MBLNU459_g7431t1 [Dothideomycetes sp. NU459]